MEKTKLTKNEYLDSLDPDNLNLEKKDLINFCNKCIAEWSKNKRANFKFILSMELIKSGVRLTPEDVLKTVWKKILTWFWDLQYQNALAERINGILKQEFLLYKCRNMAELKQLVEESIFIYNEMRPHLSLDMKTPNQVHKKDLALSHQVFH